MSDQNINYKNMSRDERMRSEPIEKLIPELAIPTIITMLVTSIYNMADTYFVSQIGTSASGAVGIIFSAMTLIQAVAFTIGMGSGINMSRLLGSGNRDEAHIFASTGFFTGLIVGVVVLIIGLTNLNSVVMLLGSTKTIAPYAEEYAQYIFAAAPFMMAAFILNQQLRFQGLSLYSMAGIVTGGILNIILDPLFIFVLGMGTGGAGLATGISQFISFCILLYMTNSRKETVKIKFRNFKPSLAIYGKILYNGVPSLARQGISSVSTIILNTIAGGYGDAAVAAMSIVLRFTMFIHSVVVGFGQGFQPVCSFNFGSGNIDRVKKSFWFCVKVSTITLIVLCLISFIFSGEIIEFFRKDDPEVIEIGTFALRANLITMPLWGYYTMSNMFSQSIGYGFRSTIISCARQGLCLIPVLLIVPRFFGLTGLQVSQPISDVLAFVLSWILVSGILKEIGTKQKELNAA